MAQRVYFDPTKTFERRLFNSNQNNNQKKVPAIQEPDYIKKAKSASRDDMAEGLIQHSVKRVKKKINDYILSNYEKLFFNNKAKSAGASSKETPQSAGL